MFAKKKDDSQVDKAAAGPTLLWEIRHTLGDSSQVVHLGIMRVEIRHTLGDSS